MEECFSGVEGILVASEDIFVIPHHSFVSVVLPYGVCAAEARRKLANGHCESVHVFVRVQHQCFRAIRDVCVCKMCGSER